MTSKMMRYCGRHSGLRKRDDLQSERYSDVVEGECHTTLIYRCSETYTP